MSVTDELRAILDERVVEWWAEESEIDHVTVWNANGGHARFYEPKTTNHDLLQVGYYDCTPAQAVEATLGRGMCQIEERHGEWRCTRCGEIVGDSDPWSELYINGNAIELWRYCPWCGREVVQE